MASSRGPFAALRHPLYRRVWSANFVSTVGDWMQIIGRGALVYELTGSASALGFIYFVSYIPALVVMPFGGVFADRYDRRRTLLFGQVAQTALAVLIGVLAGRGDATLANVAAVSLGAGLVQTLTMPAQMALTPSLVPAADLPSAMSLSIATNNVARVLGPALAGLTIAQLGVAWIFYVNAATFVVVLLTWLVTHVPARVAIGEQTTWRALGAGWRHVRHTPALLLPIVIVAVLSAIGLAYQTLGVAYTTEVLAGGDEALGNRYYGVFQSVIGLGGIAGIVGLTRSGRRRPAATLLGTAAGFGVSLVVLSAVRRPILAFAVCFVVGVFHFANSNLVLTLVQRGAPEAMRGRVMSILLVAWIGLFPLTSLGIGGLADAIGIRAVIGWSGAICFLAAVLAIRWSHVVGEADDAPAPHPASTPLTVASEEA